MRKCESLGQLYIQQGQMEKKKTGTEDQRQKIPLETN